ncbi:lysophospholipid acyltransferase family protein [Micromonospora sp. WMMB482]|uniref:lysophospholipid acyltransferase family protein n=1 Tax=Micromonospora sp. WMMB482 TaxID=2849653 RepID=UPI0035AEC830
MEGLEHIPATGGAIFASNHLSVADELLLGTVVPRHLAFWAKSEYFTGTGPQGRLLQVRAHRPGRDPGRTGRGPGRAHRVRRGDPGAQGR